ncbi:hypothetical protein EST38_g10248 [Candolleomyces aberdarensis]|uniref:Uncharacterized protein n=1 Tax=Candolleomyces aberdarensis TaxID=2316362 RepID=A0A4Q2D8J9_9AGAR|nr:hypothetical protein EST38_g10248 [Candolleomyces aberdarensis]
MGAKLKPSRAVAGTAQVRALPLQALALLGRSDGVDGVFCVRGR